MFDTICTETAVVSACAKSWLSRHFQLQGLMPLYHSFAILGKEYLSTLAGIGQSFACRNKPFALQRSVAKKLAWRELRYFWNHLALLELRSKALAVRR